MLRTPWHGGPICCAPHGMGDLYAAHPMAWGTYMLRKFVGVGFHSSQGEGAAS
jgi:hypothetical protein